MGGSGPLEHVNGSATVVQPSNSMMTTVSAPAGSNFMCETLVDKFLISLIRGVYLGSEDGVEERDQNVG